MVGALTDPFDDCHMGVTAENIAEEYEISRADQDKLAVESHRRAAAAIEQGYFKRADRARRCPDQEGRSCRSITDEHVRSDITRWRSWPG